MMSNESPAQLRATQKRRDRSLRDRTMSLETAAALITDGEHVGIGGSMMSRTPMAMIWQLVRSRRKDLVCYRPIATSEGDILLASGLVRRVVTSWFSQGIMWGVSRVMRQHVANDPSSFEEWSHLALGMRLKAGAMGVPFMPVRTMLGSDVQAERPEVHEMNCPFTGDKVLLVPALNPQTAIIHVQRCDKYGNAQIDGMTFMDLDMAMAADRVILTTEKIIPNDDIRDAPDRTVIPFLCVDAVVEVPYGSIPHECYGLYEPIMSHLDAYARAANLDPAKALPDYLDRYFYSPYDWDDYLSLIGKDAIADAEQAVERPTPNA